MLLHIYVQMVSVREWFMEELRIETVSAEVWLKVLSARLFFLPIGPLDYDGLSWVLQIFRVSNSTDTVSSPQGLLSEGHWIQNDLSSWWKRNGSWKTCLCWPSGFPSWREGEELQEGEAVNLCLHRKQSSWWLCSVNTIEQLIINVDFTWKEKKTWKVKGIWITLSESFQKTDELHMLITRVCLDPQTWCSQPWWMVFDCLLGICNPTPPLIPSVEIYCIFYSPGCCLSLNKTHTHQKKWARAVVFLEDG